MKCRRLSFLILPAMFLFATLAQAGPNSGAHIAIHLKQPVAKNACNLGAALPTCSGINTTGQLYPPTAYFAYVLATDMEAAGGLRAVGFGINYDGAPFQGVDVYSWVACSDLEFRGDDWPEPGTGTLVTWSCSPLSEPGGPGTGGTGVAGYFYIGAYTPGELAITPRPQDSGGIVSNCSGFDDMLQPMGFPPLGWATFTSEGTLPGSNPCGEGWWSSCHLRGPTIVAGGQQNILYTIDPGEEGGGGWHIDGDGQLTSNHWLNYALVDAGPSGAYTIHYTRFLQPDLSHGGCSVDVTINATAAVPTGPQPARIEIQSVPNPCRTGGMLILSADATSSPGWISVFDVSGRRVSRQPSFATQPGELSWSAAGLIPGTYFVRLEDGAGKPVAATRVVVTP